VAKMSLLFLAPNARVVEGVKIALNTWNELLNSGITDRELVKTRTSLINNMMQIELNVFDKSSHLLSTLLAREPLSPIMPNEAMVERLSLQTDVSEVNKMAQYLKSLPVIPVITIMGNPDDDSLRALSDIANNNSEFKEIPYRDVVISYRN
jgi:hypothetical protein